MANAYNYSNTAVQTTLSGNISGGSTSLTVAVATGFPGSTPYVLAVDYGAATEELVVVTAVGGTTLTVTRGFSGTSAQSHSIGAVVRHVVNAQDLTDFRTHEASTGAVHGLTGAIVGTSDVQTLSNKTLTSPTVNSGALAGTFSGAHTYSGAVTMSGGGTLTGTFTGSPTLSGNPTFSGTPVFGAASFSGIAAHTGEITHANLFRGTRAVATDSQWETRQAGDAFARMFIQADGKHWWGSGAVTVDTNLYRSAVDTLRTDDSLIVSGSLSVLGTTTWTPYTPTVAGGGSVTWTDRAGYYYRLGRIIFINIFLTVNAPGSGGTAVSIDMPSSADRSARQSLAAHCDGMGGGLSGANALVAFTSGSGATFDRLRTYDNQNVTGAQLAAGATITVQGWYRET